MKQCDFSNYKVGDRVWHIRDGWQKIIAITDHKECPIRTEIGVYAIDGKYNKTDKYPTIFHNEFKIPDEAFIKPLPTLEIDTKVLVWNNGYEESKLKRYFKEFDRFGNIICFINGSTSWSATGGGIAWDNYEVVQDI